MKKILVLAMVIISFSATAQKKQRPCMPSEGYWVVETNVKSPRESTVHFYTNDAILVYREKVSGRKINIKKKKTVRELNAVLTQSITAWHKEKTLKVDLSRVSNRL